jgi:hypothetical protein
MQKKIEKIGHMQHLHAFIQFNLIRGFKYIDNAGEIVNLYAEDKAPDFKMDLDGLVIEKPISDVRQLKVTPHQLWMRVDGPGSLDQPIDLYTREANKILTILDVSKIKRVGWRSYLVLDMEDVHQRAEIFNRRKIVPGSDITELKIDLKSDSINIALRLHQVLKNDDKRTPGILFDVDLFCEGIFSIQESIKILKKFKDFMNDKDKGFLSIVNSFICPT